MVSGEIEVIQTILSKQFLCKQIFVQAIFVKNFSYAEKDKFLGGDETFNRRNIPMNFSPVRKELQCRQSLAISWIKLK